MDPDGLAFQDLEVGKVFKTTEEVEQFVKNWGARHLSPFIVRSSLRAMINPMAGFNIAALMLLIGTLDPKGTGNCSMSCIRSVPQ